MKNKLVSVSIEAHPEQDTANVVGIDNVGSAFVKSKFGVEGVHGVVGCNVNKLLDELREKKISYSFSRKLLQTNNSCDRVLS